MTTVKATTWAGMLLVALSCGGVALAAETPKTATATDAKAGEAKAADAAATDATAPKEKKARYKKSKQVDFSDQTVEGKLHRPEASLVTASEGVTDNGLLRLREDFLDKFTTYVGEEIQQ